MSEDTAAKSTMAGWAFIAALKSWAASQPGVARSIVVGSYARGCETPDSDVDVIVLCTEPEELLSRLGWVEQFGVVEQLERTNYRTLTTLSIRYRHGLRVEIGVAGESWDTRIEEVEVRTILETGKLVLYEHGHDFAG